MKEQEILQNNKLIAEFCGWKFIKLTDADDVMPPCYVFMQYDENGRAVRQYSGGDCWNVETAGDIPYDSDWNWLMPVVEKIEGMGYGLTIDGTICEIYKSDRDYCIKCADTKLSATYEAVCDFIKQVKG